MMIKEQLEWYTTEFKKNKSLNDFATMIAWYYSMGFQETLDIKEPRWQYTLLDKDKWNMKTIT